MNSQPHHRYQFGAFRLDTSEHSLCRDGEVIPLEPKVFDLLRVLVQSNGRLLQKEELLKEVWPDSFVEEANVARNISILRKVLGEDPYGKLYIETVPKRGYRFVAIVKEITGNGLGAVATDLNSQVEAAQVPRVTEERGRRRTLSARHWLVLGGLVSLVLGILLYSFLAQRLTAVAGRPEIKSIAVLPLQNLSGDPAQEYFADGMTETLISNLAQIHALRVISRTSVMSFKDSKRPLPSLPEIARELRVDAVVEGSTHRANGRVKVMIQLIHGPTDTHLWAREYERPLTDVLRLQSEMARAIAEEIRIQVTPEERTRMSSAATVNPAAHEAYLLGRFHLSKHIIDDHRRAISHFERVIQLDPNYAPAYAGLSLAWQRLGVQRRGALGDVEPQARAAAQKALELDDRLAEAYVARGYLQCFYDWDWAGAENTLRRALELDANNLDAHLYYSILLMTLGRFAEALAEIQAAERMDPLSHQVQSTMGKILCLTGRHDEAEERLKQAIEREPRSANALNRLAQVYEHTGRYTEALALYDKARTLRGNPPQNRSFLAMQASVYARMGRRNEAKRLLADLGDDGPAAAYAALGEKDAAFKMLFRAMEERKAHVVAVRCDPQFSSLHSDPRWKELLRRMNFPVE